jgi:phosphoglucosamine mutase
MFQPLPQLLRNLKFNGGQPLERDEVKAAIVAAEAALGDRGRVLIRKSGTEPVIRIMAEGEDEAMVGRVVEEIAQAIQRVAK